MAYSDGEKAAALITLAQNKYDYAATSDALGIPARTLRRWDKKVTKTGGVPELLERAIQLTLANVPKEFAKGTDWAVTLGILIDKWLVMQGEATSRTENIVRNVEGLSDDERRAVVAEAQRILQTARMGGGADLGGGEDDGE